MEIIIVLAVLAVVVYLAFVKQEAKVEQAVEVSEIKVEAVNSTPITAEQPAKAPAKAPAKKRTFVKREEGGTAKVANVKAKPAAKKAVKTTKPKA